MANIVDLEIYRNNSAGSVRKNKAILDSINGNGIEHIYSADALKALKNWPQKFIVDGGEGSNWVLIQEMFRRGLQIRPIGLMGSGTQNVLFEILKKAGRTMTIDEFREAPADKIPGFRPGQVGGSALFNNQFAIGAYERQNGEFNKALGFFPKGIRPMLVRGMAGMSAVLSSDTKIDMYSVVPRIGKVEAFPKQDPFGPNITHAWIEGKNPSIKLAKVLFLWWRNKIPPEGLSQNLLRTEQAPNFDYVKSFTPTAWVDGDTMKNPAIGFLHIRRTNFEIPMVAIII